MRVAFLVSVLFIAFAACAAQEATGTYSTKSRVVIVPDDQQPQSMDSVPATPFATRNLSPRLKAYRFGVSDSTCFTMRSYLFSPSTKGVAPQPTGYTTCTPSRALQMRQTKQPKARYVPQ